MIWLASYPRSGNTFVREILHEVYGLPSVDIHRKDGSLAALNFEEHTFVKTHQPYAELSEAQRQFPSVYILRDGRDALISWAHYLKDFIHPEGNFLQLLSEGIIASEGSYFAGWSLHAWQWIQQADIVIRYEDLIREPLRQVEKINRLIKLPPAAEDKLPSFSDLKNSKHPYGFSKFNRTQTARFFRKGKTGGWKDDFPQELLALFYSQHGEVLEQLGYFKNGAFAAETDFEKRLQDIKKTCAVSRPAKKILIEAQKLSDSHRDGINRYVGALTKNMAYLQHDKGLFRHLDIDLLVRGNIVPLRKASPAPAAEPQPTENINRVERIKRATQKALPGNLYAFFRKLYLASPARSLLAKGRLAVKLAVEWRNIKRSAQRFGRYDLIHITLPQHFQYFRWLKHNFLVTVHDMTHRLFPEFHLSGNIRNANKGMRLSKKRNAHILAVSGSTKKDILNLEDYSYGAVTVIPEAAEAAQFNKIYDERIIRKVLKKYNLTQGAYLFSLATFEPRKNTANTIRAFLKMKEHHPALSVQLALAGKAGWKFKNDLDNHPSVVSIGYVPDEDLPALFSGALGFCYVSHYEGFGLPLLEAMRCGCAVVYGDNSSMKEIVGSAGLPADSRDVAAISQQMEKLLCDEKLRRNFQQKAFLKSLEYSWEKTARTTLNLYDKLTTLKTPDTDSGRRIKTTSLTEEKNAI